MDNAKLWIGVIGVLAVLGLIAMPAIGVVEPTIIGALSALAFGALSALGGMAIPNVKSLYSKPDSNEPPLSPPGR